MRTGRATMALLALLLCGFAGCGDRVESDKSMGAEEAGRECAGQAADLMPKPLREVAESGLAVEVREGLRNVTNLDLTSDRGSHGAVETVR